MDALMDGLMDALMVVLGDVLMDVLMDFHIFNRIDPDSYEVDHNIYQMDNFLMEIHIIFNLMDGHKKLDVKVNIVVEFIFMVNILVLIYLISLLLIMSSIQRMIPVFFPH